MKNREKSALMPILIMAWVTYTAAYLCRVNISTALDKLSVGMNVSLEYLGYASSVYFVTYAVGQLVNGIIGDRVYAPASARDACKGKAAQECFPGNVHNIRHGLSALVGGAQRRI